MSNADDPFLVAKPGHFIFNEGDAGTEMFIIESGVVDIVRGDRREVLATLEAGDFFGEMAILEDQPRFAGAVAKEEARLLRIDRAHFNDVLTQNVEIAIRIMRKLTARLRRSEQRATEAHAALEDFRKKLASAPAPAPARPAPAAPAPAAPAPAPVAAPAAPAAPTAPSAGNFRFLHPASGGEFPLVGKIEYLVGRPDPVTGINPEVNLGGVDESRSLSRRHAKVKIDGSGAWLREDVGTTNGTYVNGQKLATGVPVQLRPGDKVKFGSVEVEFLA